jgi:hypothetical protein
VPPTVGELDGGCWQFKEQWVAVPTCNLFSGRLTLQGVHACHPSHLSHLLHSPLESTLPTEASGPVPSFGEGARGQSQSGRALPASRGTGILKDHTSFDPENT